MSWGYNKDYATSASKPSASLTLAHTGLCTIFQSKKHPAVRSVMDKAKPNQAYCARSIPTRSYTSQVAQTSSHGANDSIRSTVLASTVNSIEREAGPQTVNDAWMITREAVPVKQESPDGPSLGDIPEAPEPELVEGVPLGI
jgi:hypothetical protein